MSESSPSVATVKVDAKQRGIRTLVQGAAAAIVVAVVPVINAAVTGGVDKINWQVLEVSALTAGIMALSAYVLAFVKPAVTSDPITQAIFDDAVAVARQKALDEVALLAPVDPQVVNNVVLPPAA